MGQGMRGHLFLPFPTESFGEKSKFKRHFEIEFGGCFY